MQKGDRQLTEFTVTPMIQHAATVLRAAIPKADRVAGAIGVDAMFGEGGFWIRTLFPNGRRGAEIHPTDEQAAAAYLLAAAFGLQQASIGKAYGITQDFDERLPPEYVNALRRLNADARRKANIEGSTLSYYDREVTGGVTVYL